MSVTHEDRESSPPRLCAVLLIILFGAAALSAFRAPEHNAATAEPPQPGVSLPPELSRVLTDYENAWNRRDSAALARLFAEDGFVLADGSPMVRGRAAIERFYGGAGRALSLRAFAYAAEGSVGYIIGAFGDRPGAPDRGKFTLTLRRDSSGRWLIMSDMDNGNSHPPAPSLVR